MPVPYQQNKQYRDKWNKNNYPRFLEMSRINQRKYDGWKRIQKIFLKILLE